jgi:hypothetical protein
MIVAIAAAVLILAGAVFYFVSGNSGSKPKPVLAAAVNDWIADFAPNPVLQRNVSILRSSVNATDYRVEFESAIQAKGLGWVYRARDPQNFYVNKIELRTPGAVPAFIIAHYAVIHGVDQARTETPLNVQVPIGADYKIRFEAVGNRFTTWVQGQKADEWTDDQLASGGTGTYREGIEQASLNGAYQVTPLGKDK